MSNEFKFYLYCCPKRIINSISRNFNFIAFLKSERTVKLWDTLKRTLMFNIIYKKTVIICTVFSPFEHHIALNLRDASIRVWNLV